MPSLTSCTDHPKRPAVGTCPVCGKPYCERCMSYRGTKYVCKKCAPSVPAEKTMVMERDPFGRPGSSLKASVAEEEAQQEKKQKKPKSTASRYKRSRYGSSLVLRQAIKKLMIVLVLLILGILAYLPPISKLAVEDAYENGYIGVEHAPKVAIWSGRIHILYGREEEAIDIFEEALETLPEADQALVYFYMGEAFMKMLDLELATKHYSTFLRRWPTHDLALEAGQKIEEIKQIEKKKELNQRG